MPLSSNIQLLKQWLWLKKDHSQTSKWPKMPIKVSLTNSCQSVIDIKCLTQGLRPTLSLKEARRVRPSWQRNRKRLQLWADFWPNSSIRQLRIIFQDGQLATLRRNFREQRPRLTWLIKRAQRNQKTDQPIWARTSIRTSLSRRESHWRRAGWAFTCQLQWHLTRICSYRETI